MALESEMTEKRKTTMPLSIYYMLYAKYGAITWENKGMILLFTINKGLN